MSFACNEGAERQLNPLNRMQFDEVALTTMLYQSDGTFAICRVNVKRSHSQVR